MRLQSPMYMTTQQLHKGLRKEELVKVQWYKEDEC